MTTSGFNCGLLVLQSQAMPKFQTDIDDETGQDVLTCFLLPQLDTETDDQPTLGMGKILWRSTDIVIHFESLSGSEIARYFFAARLQHANSERIASLHDVSLKVRPTSRVVFAGVETDSEAEEYDAETAHSTTVSRPSLRSLACSFFVHAFCKLR